MNSHYKVLLGAILLLLPLASVADTPEPTVKITPIKANLYLLKGKGGNVVASVGDDGILIIDDDYVEYGPAYHRALMSISETDGVPRLVLNTHWHFDHVGSNAYWGERGSVILAQANVYERMSTQQEIQFFDLPMEPSPAVALPIVTFDDTITLRFNRDKLRVQHFPGGHTDGDSVVFFTGENVVHMGDQYFKDLFPFVDIGSGGNVLGLTANVATILGQVDEETVIVPGHGALANRAELAKYHQMLVTTTEIVRSKLAQGVPVEAIIDQGLGQEWTSWGQGAINEPAWISFIAASIPPPE
tara:strand:- start:4996 stop:5898 length:903 start_codon:yes stop_codon:yes gene_type:complete